MTKSQPIEVTIWIDFASSYAYLAVMRHEEWARQHHFRVRFQPFLLALLFRDFGKHPILDMPQKAKYAFMDVSRTARAYGIPYALPSTFPFKSVASCRMFYAIPECDRTTYLMGVFRHNFEKGVAVDSDALAVAVLSQVCPHLDAEAYGAQIANVTSKRALFDVGKQAVQQGVCGAPFFVVTEEDGTTSSYWGHDRMEFIPRDLARRAAPPTP